MFFRASLFYFFYFAAVAIYIIFMPKILSNLGYMPSQIGILFAAAPTARFLSPFLFLSFLKLNKTTFFISIYGSIILSIIIVLVLKEFYFLLISFLFMGFFWSLMLPFVEVLTLETISKERYGKSRLYGSIGFTVMALILGQTALSIKLITFLYILTVVFTAISAFMLKDLIVIPNYKKKVSFSINHPWGFWIAIFLVQVGFGAFYNFFTIFESERGIGVDVISYLWAFGVFAEIIMFQFQYKLLHFNLITLIKISILATAFRWLLIYLYPQNLTVLYASQSIHALSLALLHTSSITYINTIYKNRQLAQQFYAGFTFGFGMLVGSLISGALYGDMLFLYSAIITFIAYLAIAVPYFNTQKSP